ncbi:MAG: biopolymer transporter TolR [Bacteroidia bacterium]
MFPRQKICLLIVISIFLPSMITAQFRSSGIFENHSDIGNVKKTGSVSYDSENQEYTISGAGANMWEGEDQFHYLWTSIQGDFIVRARMEFTGEEGDPHRKIGWIIRNNFRSGSPHVNATVHGDGTTALQFRREEGGKTESLESADMEPNIIQLERKGNTYIMSTAKYGKLFTEVKLTDMNLRNEVFVGLYVCSHNPDKVEKARFSNVRIVKPAPDDFRPYRDYIGSRMEVMDMETGNRKVLFTSAHSLQAPNWTNDDRLIYNSNGMIYSYDLQSEKVELVNTGFATNNNNDHVISFDGKMIGLSHHHAENNGNSTIFVMPLEGSDSPRQVTKTGKKASYFHSWTPDGKHLIFTGNRKDKYDIYQVSVEDGSEKQLTDTPGLDDGPEISPDGKYIYFNSNRTGTMQLWRMEANGSNPKQLTFDKYQDWFPHISPDNKWIVFLSFPETVDSADHPFYKRVMIRLMSIEGGEPKVIAYLYGGQGTINVPSWSPDGKKIAFVSNSD